MAMDSHHEAWLAAHPGRSREWLVERLRDGFDIHHIDGNHGNNDARNLVLIECSDHLMLHNGGTRVDRVAVHRPKIAARALVDRECWERHEAGESWREVGDVVFVEYHKNQRATKARVAGKRHAARIAT